MKKLLAIYLIILVGVFALFANIDQKSDYTIERKIWKVTRLHQEVAKDPEAVPDQEYERIISAYQKIIADYPDSELTRSVYLLIARIYSIKKDFKNARAQYQEVVKKFPDDDEFSAGALSYIANTYEVEDNWPAAHKIYQEILQKYPLTFVGFEIPIYIAKNYKKQNDYQNAIQAYDYAVKFYNDLASQYPGTALELKSLDKVSTVYIDQKRWKESLDVYRDILIKFAPTKFLTRPQLNALIKRINILCAYQIKDYNVAINLYQNIIDNHPDFPFNKYLKKVIAGFSALKEKGIDVTESPQQNENLE